MTAVDLTRAVWRKSTASGGNGNWVEVAADLLGIVGVRDSKNPDGGPLTFTPEERRAFIGEAKDGAFDL